ncbi:MAG: very short patch repair endonuclease [Acidiphilium sp.]|nr:very short patch repair endonuclease [Acidiphilium sp.]
MAGIRGKNTAPEMIIRRGLHRLGFRFRIHDRRLPGQPDLVLPRWRAAVFVHGCFWHGHDCALFRWPRSREAFWREKITRNRERDAAAFERLRCDNWRVLTIWECALKGPARIGAEETITHSAAWLRSGGDSGEVRGPHGNS